MVDEFQDVSKKQYRLAQLLAGKHGNLFIVGDPDQTIYSWRGSHLRLFLDFDRVYPTAKTITLVTNYRSTPEILAASNCLIEKNTLRFPKSLLAIKAAGPRPRYFHAKNERQEADWILDEIDRLRASGVGLDRCAVLYRAHYLTRALEERFIERGVPYRIFSGIEFYGRREIKDIICYLRMVTTGDDVAFLRTVNLPARKFGKKRLAALSLYAQHHQLSLYQALKDNLTSGMLNGSRVADYVAAIETVRQHRTTLSLGNSLQSLLDLSGYEQFLRLQGDQERLDNVAEFKRTVENEGADEEATLEDFLARVALFTHLDDEPRAETVKLMTIHGAKGMEFPYVFICGLNEGVFPSRKISSAEEMEEERRLAYVAMTRAMDGLYLSDAQGVANDGLVKYPSRFIFDAGSDNIAYDQPLDPAMIMGAAREATDSEARDAAVDTPFHAGDRVAHPVFGSGTIIAIYHHENAYGVKFDGLATERNMQFSAPLKPLM